MVKARGDEVGKLVRLTAPEREAIRIAASFLLSGEWSETITTKQCNALKRAYDKM